MTELPLRIACAVVGVCLSASALQSQTFQAAAADSQTIRDLIALHADASQHGDFDRLIKGYQADADVRYSDGSVFRGLAEIKPRIREILSNGPTSMAHAPAGDNSYSLPATGRCVRGCRVGVWWRQ